MTEPAFRILARDPSSPARAAILTTSHGAIETPCFLPVGTRGAVKGVEFDRLEEWGCRAILSNTYHLMAVDSNVLIFERIREELRAGRAPKTAIDNGFSKAFATIIDTHLTVIISAIFLFQFGTGPVKGFAVTLILGLLISVFTAVFVSHTIFELVYGRRQHIDALSI